ncbi:cilia- and flagella-associated protein 44 isoform X2 [Bacillus rossius redtenbacheri]|uniref:cilia- and flagella-associated protein 44 isoform X2 n=1 Tax=Bacillus rossius redtenbacheri TaxID=93214 RepID=UPI002FDF09AA
MSQETSSDGEDVLVDEDSGQRIDNELPDDPRKSSQEELDEDIGQTLEEEDLDPDRFYSKPFLSENCTLPENILEFHYSFGYSCKRHFNLCVMDETKLIFISGNLLHFYDVETKHLSFRRSVGGCGIGHLTRHPNLPHLAVGEKGTSPLLIIYEWPSFNVVCLLRYGAKKEYAYLDYSPDGELLLSQAGDPDYMLTIWDWHKSTALLRGQSYTQDVINARFSNYVAGHLTSSGFGHIKFWKMAETFTGLKLKGALGRFGKTEICDIVGFLAMPDEKVVTGCEWGNILLWEEGLIKAEICRKNRVPCHTAPITQFQFHQKELTSIGLDGMIKMWYFETIDHADPPENDSFIEIEPMFQCEIRSGSSVASLMSLVKKANRPDDHFWYAQDANGGIWEVDLNVDDANDPPRQLVVCHAGAVVDIATSPCKPYLASLGEDGRLFFYNYRDKKLLATKQFGAKGMCLIWFPRSVANGGNLLAAGFSDGVVRVLASSLRLFEASSGGGLEAATLVQVVKPHVKPVTVLSVNPQGLFLISGSEDRTVFIHLILRRQQHVSLVPIGFVDLPGSATFIEWKPKTKGRFLVSCSSGHVLEMSVPSEPRSAESYRLTPLNLLEIDFHSVKAQIRRDIELAEMEKRQQEKLERKREELQRILEENPEADIDEETFLEDSEPSIELEPLYIPPVPNPVLFATYLDADVVWLSLGGYDAGYMYQYKPGQSEPLKVTMIPDADDIEIHSFAYNCNKNYLVLGMQDGKIRVTRVNPNDPSDLTDYWSYSMHDNTNGYIPRVCFSPDQRYLFSCGADGNLFSYSFNVPPNEYPEVRPAPVVAHALKIYGKIGDVDGSQTYSLEESKIMEDEDRKMELAEEHKQEIKFNVVELAEKYHDIVARNDALPESQRLSEHELELHWTITADLKAIIDGQMELEMRKLAFDVEKSQLGLAKLKSYFFDCLDSMTTHVFACRSDSYVTTFRQRKLLDDFYAAKKYVQEQLAPKEDEGRQWQDDQRLDALPPESDVPAVDSFLKGLSLTSINYKRNAKLVRAIERYRARKQRMEARKREWSELYSKEPGRGVIHPDDAALIAEAERTVGDYHLKASPDYRVPPELQINTVKKFDQVLRAREQEFMMKHRFNEEVYTLRSRKLSLIEDIGRQRRRLAAIHRELSAPQAKPLPEIPSVKEELEFPEKFLEVKPGQAAESADAEDGSADEADWELEMLAWRTAPDRSCPELPDEEFQKLSQVSRQRLAELAQQQDSSSAWEAEMSRARNMRKVHEQEVILQRAADSVRRFDEDVGRLAESRLQLEVDAALLELHSVKLSHELSELTGLTEPEAQLTAKVLVRTADEAATHAKIQELQDRMNDTILKIEALKNKMKNLFASAEEIRPDNIFAEYLRKIFMRKYKPPKVVRRRGTGEDSDSEDESDEDSLLEESSTEDDDEDYEDEAMLSSAKQLLKLDESVCPEGLDVEIYNKTFALRQERYDTEQQILDESKNLDIVKKELEVVNNSTKALKNLLDEAIEELEELQRVKQRRLNTVECVVLLSLDRLQLVGGGTGDLVFHRRALARLQARPGEIEQETEDQKAKDNEYRQNLRQLRIDYKDVKVRIEELKEKAKKCMENKFGCKIDLRELEETVLRMMVADMKFSVKDVAQEYSLQMRELQEKMRQKEEILSFAMQENTEKLNLLTILEEEKNKLESMLQVQLHRMEHPYMDREAEYQQDIQRLESIARKQAEQIRCLQEETKHLTCKSRPPRPAVPCAPAPEEQPGTGADSRDQRLSQELSPSPPDVRDESASQ